MVRKFTLTVLLLIAIGMCTGCSETTVAEPSLELVKYNSYSLDDASFTITAEDGEELPIGDLYIRNTGEEAICWITIGESWLDENGEQVAQNNYGFQYPDVVLPGQTVRIEVSAPEQMDKQNREKIKSFSFGEYSYETVSGNSVTATFTDAPESLPLSETETITFSEDKSCQESPLSGDVVLLEDDNTLTVDSIKYDAGSHRLSVTLTNKSEKRIDWSDEPSTPVINFQWLGKDGNIRANVGWAEITEEGLDPGQSITVEGDTYWVGNEEEEEYITVTGIFGFVYTPFHAIPKAVKPE